MLNNSYENKQTFLQIRINRSIQIFDQPWNKLKRKTDQQLIM